MHFWQREVALEQGVRLWIKLWSGDMQPKTHELGANVRKGEHGSLVVYANIKSTPPTRVATREIVRR